MKKFFNGFVAALLLSASTLSITASAEDPRVRANVPDAHVVVKGDTLWDISGYFLENPWLWPEIWHVNAQIDNPHLIYPGDVIRLIYVDGKPRLTVDTSGRTFKMSPKARVLEGEEAIDAIPLDKINSFLSRSRIVTKEELAMAPYVVSGMDQHLIVGAGDKLYVRGPVGDVNTVYGVYRKGEEFRDPDTKERLGIQALDIGTGKLHSKKGEISTLDVTRTTEEIRIGDKLLREEERAVDSTFYPSPPSSAIDATILAVEGGLNQVGKMDVIVINRGAREDITPGNVLAVYKRGGVIRDRVAGGTVALPDERAGLVMVFRVFEKISFGLVLEAERGLSVNDRLLNP